MSSSSSASALHHRKTTSQPQGTDERYIDCLGSHARSHSYSYRNNSRKLNHRDNTKMAAAQQPSLLKLTSVLSSIAQLPGKRVAKVAKKIYSNPNSQSEPDLVGVRSCPGTPPPDYDSAMETEVETCREVPTRPKNKHCISGKYASQGHQLLSLSLSEIEEQRTDSSFTRQLYIHSLTYLLRALPESLTADEITSISSALPDDVVASITSQIQASQTCPCQTAELDAAALPKHPTVHKIAKLSAASMVSLMRTLTPHVKILVLQVWLFCQRHRVAERTLGVAKWMGDTGLWAGGAFLEWLDLQSLLYDETELNRQQTELEVRGTAEDGSGVVLSGVVTQEMTARRRFVKGGAEAGGRFVKGFGSWVGGVVSSSVGGAVEGISSGLERS